jgi:hypothetical protein
MGAFEQGCHAAQQRDVAGDLLLDLRPQHLDHDLAPRRHRQARGMHLRDRGRGQRRGVEIAVGGRRCRGPGPARPRRAQFAVEGRDPILQLGQLVGDVGRHQVAPGREDLPELDEDRAEFLQCEA